MEAFYSRWWRTAIWQHILYGIPASITLAQASIESNNGNSRLAREGNNYFGIKAYSNPYNMPVIYANDDAIGEPFIKYSDPKLSFVDHSLFLERYGRYDKLFESHDFNKWADGLQSAGYATSQTYAKLLKDKIQESNLAKWDWIGANKWIISIVFFVLIAILIYFIYRALRTKKHE